MPKGYNLAEKWKDKISKTIHLQRANHCFLSKEAKEWIDGELLGDGCLQSQRRYSANFHYSSKYPEYIQYISIL